MLNQSDSSN